MCEPRVLLSADFNFTTRMNSPTDGLVSCPVIFLTTPGSSVTFSGATLGVLTPTGGGAFHYVPHPGAMGFDHIIAHFHQPPATGMLGMMTPTDVNMTVDMTIFMPTYIMNDDSYNYIAPNTTQPILINYFVLKGNTLSVGANDGVLKNDSDPDIFQYLTAHQVGNGQYGQFSISGSGAFSYTPYAWAFNSPLFGDQGLTDTCQYYDTDPLGNVTFQKTVKVDLAKSDIYRNGMNSTFNEGTYPLNTQGPAQINSSLNTPWIGEHVELVAHITGKVNAPIEYHWTVPFWAVEGYSAKAGKSNATVDELDSDDFLHSSISLYWIDSGQKNAEILINTMGQSLAKSETLFVRSPSATFSARTHHFTEHTDNGITEIIFGDFSQSPITPGVIFKATIDSGGDYTMNQTVVSILTRTNNGVTESVIARGVDSGRFDYSGRSYDSILLAFPRDAGLWNDSPSSILQDLVAGTTAFSRSDSFISTLMFKPDILQTLSRPEESIWVSLSSLHWSGGISASRDNTGNWTWAQYSSGTYDQKTIGQATFILPQFTNSISSQLPFSWFLP